MFELPKTPTDHNRLADWLEIRALKAKDRNASAGDLERALKRAALAELPDDIAVERKTAEVFAELTQRAKAAGEGYPFDAAGGVLRLTRRGPVGRESYIFCLCLSWFGDARIGKLYPRRLFEHVAALAARGYLAGDSIRFGAPRSGLPSSFPAAIDAVTDRFVREGKGFKGGGPPRGQDRRVDIIAWRHFPDAAPSKLVLFGQCASGNDWDKKVSELDPLAFMNTFFIDPLSPHAVVKAFFVPHQLPTDVYQRQLAGIVFDRCRIAAMTPKVPGTSIGNVLTDCRVYVEQRLSSIDL